MKTGVVTSLAVTVCDDVKDAVYKGHVYRPPVYHAVSVEKVVVVRNSMESGKASVDFIMEDDDGRRTVFMITENLLNTIVSMLHA